MTDNTILLSIFTRIKNLISDSAFIEESKTKPVFFTRPSRCKLTFQMLVLFLLTAAKKSIQVELNLFLSEVNAMCLSYSKQAFSKRRNCVKWEAIQKIYQEATAQFYQEAKYETFHGYLLAAIDGSKLNLPDSGELFTAFGSQTTGGASQNQALASCAFDVLNEMYLDAILAPCKTSERALAMEHIENIKQYAFDKVLYIFDRGYPSAELIHKVVENKAYYLFRCDKSFVRSMKLHGNDCTIQHCFTKLKDEVKLRVVRFMLNDTTEEILVTNVLESELSCSEMAELYHLRWGIESSYNCAKNTIRLEDFSGISEMAVRQDFYAAMFLYNIGSVHIFEQKPAFDVAHNSKNNKYQYKQDRAVTIGILKPQVTRMILTDSPLMKSLILLRIAHQTTRSTTRIDPGRNFLRKKKHLSLKHPQNSRHVL